MNAAQRWLMGVLGAVLLSACGGAPEPAKDPAQALREALLSAEPGSTVTIPEGHFTFDRSLSLGSTALP